MTPRLLLVVRRLVRQRDHARRDLTETQRLLTLARRANMSLSTRNLQLQDRLDRFTEQSVARDFKPAGSFGPWDGDAA